MEFHFNSLDEWIKDVQDYAAELNTPITNENGESFIQLIGIDGNPTDDESVLGNRQIIFMHFEKMYDAYLESTDNPNLKEFHEHHLMNLITSSATYRRLDEVMDNIFAEITNKFKKLDEYKQGIANGSIPFPKSLEVEQEAKVIINDIYNLAFNMKKCYEAMEEQAVSARLVNMVIGYTEVGRDFFGVHIYFEDTFTPHLEAIFKSFDSIRKMLRFDARCDSVKEMITVIN